MPPIDGSGNRRAAGPRLAHSRMPGPCRVVAVVHIESESSPDQVFSIQLRLIRKHSEVLARGQPTGHGEGNAHRIDPVLSLNQSQ